MKKILINCEGFDLGKFIIPAFELYEGELITLYLYNGAHFYGLSMKLVDIFTGKMKHNAVTLNEPLTYVKHFKESRLRRMFFPTTISRYIKNENIKQQEVIKKIYAIESEMGKLEPSTQLVMLEQTERKLLSLYSVLNQTNKIIFDLVGQSPQGAIKTFRIVKSELAKTGTAILLDGFEDERIKNESSKWIRIGVNDDFNTVNIANLSE
ncbi:MAG: hypothetical protein ACKVTZ_24150 [Bacteroidia bacterium]